MKNFLNTILMTAAIAAAPAATCQAQAKSWTGNTTSGITVDTRDTVDYRRDTAPFTAVDISTWADVVYTQGDKPSMRIAGTRQLADNLDIQVSDGTLLLRPKRKETYRRVCYGGEDSAGGTCAYLVIYVTMPQISSVDIGSMGSFVCKGRMQTDEMRISVRGVGSVRMNSLACKRMAVDISGVGGVTADRVDAQAVNIACSGTGSFKGTLNGVEYTNFDLSGVGRILATLNSCGAVKCTASGMGKVKLSGRVRTLEQSRSTFASLDTGGLYIAGK